MYERLTDRAREILQLANEEAKRFNHEYIGTEHILLGLIKEGSGVAAYVLKDLGIDLVRARREVEKIVQSGPDMVSMTKLQQTPRVKKVIEYAIEEARDLNHHYVGTEHLLLGLLREEEGVAAQVLMNLGLKLEHVREEVLDLLGARIEAKTEKLRTPALDAFGRDLTDLFREGKQSPLIGRTVEMEQALLTLSCRDRNNLLLVGEPGTGKTQMLCSLAGQIRAADGPLREQRLVALSVLPLAEHPLKQFLTVLNEVRRSRNVVLVLDDLELFIDARQSPTGPACGNAFRAALAWEMVRCVATTTPAFYQSALAGDAVYGRCLQPVFLAQLSVEETVAILRAVRERYEKHHRVAIQDEALAEAVQLSAPWSGQFPGKAIHLLDLTCALVCMWSQAQAPSLKDLDAQIEQLTQQKEAHVAEQDFDKAAQLRDEADKLKKQMEQMTRDWRDGMGVAVDKAAVVQAAERWGKRAAGQV